MLFYKSWVVTRAMEARDRAGASEEIGLNGDGLSIPLGGPIYAPNLVGPLTRVPHFESSVVQEFQSLLFFERLVQLLGDVSNVKKRRERGGE
ncbi:hypothetical protein IC575_017820 [Cucumis melo]